MAMRTVLGFSLVFVGVVFALPNLNKRQAANDNIVYITEYVAVTRLFRLTH
jgi:hypothetical protein